MTSQYTESFDQFWKAYPRKTAKPTAYNSWVKNKIEGDAFMLPAILADLEKRTRFKWWSDDKTKIPHASTWLNQRRWEDEDWEGEVSKTKNKTGRRLISAPAHLFVDEHKEFRDNMTVWQTIGNQALMLWLRSSRGVPDVTQAVRIKNEAVNELSDALYEDTTAGTPFGESKLTLMELIVSRLDREYGKNLRYRILRGKGNATTDDGAVA